MNIKMINKNSKKTIFITIIVFLIFISCIIIFLIIPSFKSIIEKSTELKKQRLGLEDSINNVYHKDNSDSALGGLNKRISTIESTFMNKGEELDLIKILESTAVKNNVIQTIFPEISKEKSDNSFFVMNLKLNLTGSFSNVLAYIKDIETLRNYINIKSINITKSKEGYTSGNPESERIVEVSCAILAETYWK